jgi:type I restriction enzyme, S subunit
MSWHDCRLGDVVTLKRGHDLPDSLRQDGEVPVVSSSGVTGYHNESKAKPPGVVTGRYGTLGEVFYIEQDYWPLNTALYVTDFKGNHPRFVAYFLQNVMGKLSKRQGGRSRSQSQRSSRIESPENGCANAGAHCRHPLCLR